MSRTRLHFERDLATLRERMLEMATCADLMVSQAVQALMTGDLALVNTVVQQDDIVDQLDVEIERLCLLLIAREQPVARDLRLIGSAMKIITDVERIADYAVDIAKIGARLANARQVYQPLVDLLHLAGLSREMLHQGLQAFVHEDCTLARQVIASDDEVDRLYHAMRETLSYAHLENPSQGLLALNVLFAVKYLERISDHVVNIAERVIFMETGVLGPDKDRGLPTSSLTA